MTQKQLRSAQLLEQNVLPWVKKFPFYKDAPVLFGAHETYMGNGCLPARTGPADAIDFENLAHEMGHAIEIFQSKGPKLLSHRGWGMRIKTSMHILGEIYYEPTTMQATEREARVVGIQKHLMEIVGHPDAEKTVNYYADVFVRFMPDWIMGGESEKERTDWSLTRPSVISVPSRHHALAFDGQN